MITFAGTISRLSNSHRVQPCVLFNNFSGLTKNEREIALIPSELLSERFQMGQIVAGECKKLDSDYYQVTKFTPIFETNCIGLGLPNGEKKTPYAAPYIISPIF